MRALVTGGAGFIGSNLVDALLERGDDVSVVDDLSTGRRENLDGAWPRRRLHEASVTDGARMPRCSPRSGPRPSSTSPPRSTSAARSPIRPSTPRSTSAAPPSCSRPRARPARAASCSPPPAARSTATRDRLPTPEDVPAAPISPYGASKAAAETYLALYRRLHGLSTVALRFANVYGPRQDPLGEGGVIAIYCHAAATAGGCACSATGVRHATSSTSATSRRRSSPRRSATSRGAYNIGTGRETTVLELVERLGLEPQLRAGAAGRDPALLPRRVAARATLGWEARVGAGRGPRAHDAPRTTKGRRGAPRVEKLAPVAAAADPLAVPGDSSRWSAVTRRGRSRS